MDRAKPSTMAVLPTPGSPTRTGLFLVLLLRTCMTRSASRDLPITGSTFPSFASWVRFLPNWSRTIEELESPPLPPVPADALSPLRPPSPSCSPEPEYPESSWMTCCLTRDRSAPSLVRTCAATPSPSRIRPNKMCSVPM